MPQHGLHGIGDEVLVPDPGYPTYSAATKLAGGIARVYDLKEGNGWLPDLEAMKPPGSRGKDHVDQLPSHAHRRQGYP
ncbi:MAG: aminotransferase class I/II-fold pyridoxal phosphate-dependent enzyme [Marinilabiliales bacterium]|nr:aminotransferase class I/II-fold pyridoxal phosphate-dependent enzyme [Marinilabiliales bacterium]